MSESSLKRWCDQGLIPTVRTAGGHRRLPVNGVLTFLRNSGYQLVHPELLGLPPSTTGGQDRKLHIEKSRLEQAFRQGDEDVGTEVVMNLYLAGIPMSAICDEVFLPIFNEIRETSDNRQEAVYLERRACELGHRVLHEVRRAMPELPPAALIALGGTLDGDPFTLASSMSEMVLRENGWRACSLGAMLPFLSLRQAVCDMRPRLVWLNVSAIPDQNFFLKGFDELSRLTADSEVTLAIGGRALTPELLSQMQFNERYHTLHELEQFARSLSPMMTERNAVPTSPIDLPQLEQSET